MTGKAILPLKSVLLSVGLIYILTPTITSAQSSYDTAFRLATKLRDRQINPQPPALLPENSDQGLIKPDSKDTLPTPENTEVMPSESIPATVRVERFEFIGNTKFSQAELTAVTTPYMGKDLSFAELLNVRSRITQFYVDQGYVTTAALIPPQTMDKGVVKIRIVEGKLTEIAVKGNSRLRDTYIRKRIKLGVETPLNVPKLLTSLQQLRLNPRITNIAADLQAGIRPGTNRLVVEVSEADTFTTQFSLDNGRSPSVGSFRRKVQITENNLLGIGDSLSAGYTNTDGSNGIDLSYTLPINAREGTLSLSYGGTRSNIIERPFSVLDILARSRYYELSLRQPISQTPTQETGLGVSFSRQESQTELGLDQIGPFALSPGADTAGRTRISALRFFQDYTQRNETHVLALRSQFSFGLDWFGANVSGRNGVNDNGPDSRFFTWRGQGQWLKQFASNAQLLVKGDVQLAGSDLVPLEQFGLGGQLTVRGYRQDALLTDSGLLLSIEGRLPILQNRRSGGLLQVTPFLDLGTGWNISGNNPTTSTLVGAGVGLLWRQGTFSARLDWGLPLVKLDGEKRSLQEQGIYFSVNYAPF
ncbi:ShlB/FhaC/HecB family hemolysin secretion/activation protein [filamentous cyanobacterium LEGE 11480]|uniref:ShlB/FhaC/HecB family hemolysin secretion/activation protein n=1 Tax=Romeriopsis navalis LEGE 11480 TaxID=2777977 RepID=A0A928VJQ2_9CYAN|nr:ShlB/FhaC/HecB family hemolysin secretion/activation protein [Romeriopsis navalis]MBE9029595.1 ShlB/FhaC/HecB family hemolysin secretion/activation protein [Romeriopsis navalis LEGE 11480]